MVDGGKPFWAITQEADGTYSVLERTRDGSIMPSSLHETKRLAAARLLQIMDLGPVAPQLEPESAEIQLGDQKVEAQPETTCGN